MSDGDQNRTERHRISRRGGCRGGLQEACGLFLILLFFHSSSVAFPWFWVAQWPLYHIYHSGQIVFELLNNWKRVIPSIPSPLSLLSVSGPSCSSFLSHPVTSCPLLAGAYRSRVFSAIVFMNELVVGVPKTRSLPFTAVTFFWRRL